MSHTQAFKELKIRKNIYIWVSRELGKISGGIGDKNEERLVTSYNVRMDLMFYGIVR